MSAKSAEDFFKCSNAAAQALGFNESNVHSPRPLSAQHEVPTPTMPVPSLNLVCTGDDTTFEYITADEAKEKGLDVKKLSGTKFRQMLRAGEDIPEWFAFKSVVEVLRAEWK